MLSLTQRRRHLAFQPLPDQPEITSLGKFFHRAAGTLQRPAQRRLCNVDSNSHHSPPASYVVFTLAEEPDKHLWVATASKLIQTSFHACGTNLTNARIHVNRSARLRAKLRVWAGFLIAIGGYTSPSCKIKPATTVSQQIASSPRFQKDNVNTVSELSLSCPP